MTTSVRIHVNGRYRATVKQDDLPPVIVEGNYEGSSNPSGERTFYAHHPAQSTFVITEEYVPEVPATAPVDQPDTPPGDGPAAALIIDNYSPAT